MSNKRDGVAWAKVKEADICLPEAPGAYFGERDRFERSVLSCVEWIVGSGCLKVVEAAPWLTLSEGGRYAAAVSCGAAESLPSVCAAAGRLGRIDLPLRFKRWLRDSSRSRIASATVASPIQACQCSTGS